MSNYIFPKDSEIPKLAMWYYTIEQTHRRYQIDDLMKYLQQNYNDHYTGDNKVLITENQLLQWKYLMNIFTRVGEEVTATHCLKLAMLITELTDMFTFYNKGKIESQKLKILVVTENENGSAISAMEPKYAAMKFLKCFVSITMQEILKPQQNEDSMSPIIINQFQVSQLKIGIQELMKIEPIPKNDQEELALATNLYKYVIFPALQKSFGNEIQVQIVASCAQLQEQCKRSMNKLVDKYERCRERNDREKLEKNELMKQVRTSAEFVTIIELYHSYIAQKYGDADIQ